MRRFWQQTELTTAVARMEDQGVQIRLRPPQMVELARATEDEKSSQLRRVQEFHAAHSVEAAEAIDKLKHASINHENVFAALMDAARVCSLQQVTEAFFEVGGQYRRNV